VSILAGTSTLIGTSTNIIVSDLSRELGHGAIGMFELSPLGVPLGLTGALVLFFLAPRLLPEVRAPFFESADGNDTRRHYISELLVPEGSSLDGKEDVRGALEGGYPEVEVYEVIGEDGVCGPLTDACPAHGGDTLLVKARADDLAHMLEERLVVLPKGEDGTEARPFDKDSLIVELIVPPGSRLVGSGLSHSLLGPDPALHILGIQRRRVHYSQQKWKHLQLTVGDIILVQAPLDHIKRLREQTDLIVVEDVVRTIVNRRMAPLAAGIFGAMVLAASTGITSILVASLAAAFFMIALGCLSLRDAYAAVDQKILLLIIGTLALGAALMKTGAAELYARTLLGLVGNSNPHLVLAVIVVMTSVLSHFLSNNATAVLAVPIGISAAIEMGVDPRPFIIGICFGASACFATPIGYQTNLLVYGPGGYRLLDYVRLGMPLNLLIWVGAIAFIPFFWPF
jgi:di/tricarboxylate transporter